MEWIEINERYPNYYEPVLVHSMDCGQSSVAWLSVEEEGDFIWTIYNTNVILNYPITHWAEIKEP